MNPISTRHRLSMVAAPIAAAGMLVSTQAPRFAAAQATPTPEAGMTATISVTGLGEVIVVPDTANIQIGVQVFSEELAEAQRMSTEQISAIIDTLTEAGVAERDIQTSNYSVSVRQNYDPQTGIATEVLGYDIYNTLSVTVRDVDTLGEILDRAVSSGANQIYGIYFYTEDLTEATAQAREKAVEDANARAQQLAAAAGIEVGRVLNINEGFPQGPIPFDYGRGFAAAEGDMAGAAVPIQTGSQTVQIMVTVTYEVAP